MNQEQQPGFGSSPQNERSDARTEKQSPFAGLMSFIKERVLKGVRSDTQQVTTMLREEQPTDAQSIALHEPELPVVAESNPAASLERQAEAAEQMKREVAAFFDGLIGAMTEQLGVTLGEADLLAKIKTATDGHKPGQALDSGFQSSAIKERLTQNRFFTFKGKTEGGLPVSYKYDFELHLLLVDWGDEKAKVSFEVPHLGQMDRLSVKLSMGYGDGQQMEHIRYNFFNQNKDMVGIERFNRDITAIVDYTVVNGKTIGFKEKQVISVNQGKQAHYEVEYPSLRVTHSYGGGSSPDISVVVEDNVEQVKIEFPRTVDRPEITLPVQVSTETIFQYIQMLVLRQQDTRGVGTENSPAQLTG